MESGFARLRPAAHVGKRAPHQAGPSKQVLHHSSSSLHTTLNQHKQIKKLQQLT